MIPHKTPRGAAALERLKAFEGVPYPYDKVCSAVLCCVLCCAVLCRAVLRVGCAVLRPPCLRRCGVAASNGWIPQVSCLPACRPTLTAGQAHGDP